jgi:hypothetical protein
MFNILLITLFLMANFLFSSENYIGYPIDKLICENPNTSRPAAKISTVLVEPKATKTYAGFDIELMGIFRDSDCAISVKVKNNSSKRITSQMLDNTKIQIKGTIRCKSGENYPYSRIISLPDFLKLPGRIQIIKTDLSIDTKGGCFTELRSELVYQGQTLDDDYTGNNSILKDFSGPCEYYISK